MQGTMRAGYSILVGKVKKKKFLEPKHRWKDNIKNYHKEIGHADVAALANQNSEKGVEFP
jgi:hypothetical protein